MLMEERKLFKGAGLLLSARSGHWHITLDWLRLRVSDFSVLRRTNMPIHSKTPIGIERSSEIVQRWTFALFMASSFIQDRNRLTFPTPAWVWVVTAE